MRAPPNLVSDQSETGNPSTKTSTSKTPNHGESWALWRILLIAIMGDRLEPPEHMFERLTKGVASPTEPVREFWGTRRGHLKRLFGGMH
jgi:hypothetical protein